MTRILVDADACPVKDEIYRVATRYGLQVLLVANKAMGHPADPLVEMVVVKGSFDAADDWIVENSVIGDIVVTTDILLADRCVKKSVVTLSPKGDLFTEDNVGSAVANRELNQNLRHTGENRGGPAPMDKKDRSRFLGTLDQVIQKEKRR